MTNIIQLPKPYQPDFQNQKAKPIGEVEIDLNNSDTDGLIFAVYSEYNESRAIVGGEYNNTLGLAGLDLDGWDQDKGGTGSVLQYARPIGMDYGLGTVIMTYKQTGTLQASCKLFVTTDAQFQLFRNGGDSNVGLSINGQTTGFNLLTFETDVEKEISVTWDSANSSRTVTVNGSKATSAVAFTGTTGAHATYNMLNRDDAARYAAGVQRYHLMYNRVLTDAEQARIQGNPYALLKPVVPLESFIVSAAAGTILPMRMRY